MSYFLHAQFTFSFLISTILHVKMCLLQNYSKILKCLDEIFNVFGDCLNEVDAKDIKKVFNAISTSSFTACVRINKSELTKCKLHL